MSCTVAIPSTPVFSPSRHQLSCKAASALPESVSSPAPAPAAGSPLHPFALRAQAEASPSPQSASAAAASVPAGSVLKRRRPAPLVLPVAGAAAVAAVESDTRNEVEEEEDEFAVYCRRGKGRRRVEMEDRHVAKVALGGDPQVALFGVFDGHGGKCAAEFAADNMPKFVAEEMKKLGSGDSGEIEGAVRRGYLKTDEEFLKREECGGTCCVTALLQKGGMVVSNAGDCRAVLSRAGKAEALTSDHRASREDERERIENLIVPGVARACLGLDEVTMPSSRRENAYFPALGVQACHAIFSPLPVGIGTSREGRRGRAMLFGILEACHGPRNMKRSLTKRRLTKTFLIGFRLCLGFRRIVYPTKGSI